MNHRGQDRVQLGTAVTEDDGGGDHIQDVEQRQSDQPQNPSELNPLGQPDECVERADQPTDVLVIVRLEMRETRARVHIARHEVHRRPGPTKTGRVSARR